MWNSDFKEYLGKNWKKAAALTGQPFSTALFERSTFDYTTEPACRAVVTARKIDENLAFDVLFALQKAFYADGKDIAREDVIAELLAPFNLKEFADRFKSEEAAQHTRRDKNMARLYGATSFPSLVLLDDQGHLGVIRGYRTFEELTKVLVE